MLTAQADLRPHQVAFLGEGESSAVDHSPGTPPVFVQALCWSRTPLAWSALVGSWASMRAYRNEHSYTLKITKGPPSPPSWVFEAVPSLGAPFRDNPAEESTLAAWISRGQISIALAMIHKQPKSSDHSEGLHYRESILECLSGYLEFLKLPGHEPFSLVLAGAQQPKPMALLAAGFRQAQERLRMPTLLAPIRVQSCAPGDDHPLPLDLTNLVSAAVLRYLLQPSKANPIFEAVRSKLIRVPMGIGSQKNLRHGAKHR